MDFVAVMLFTQQVFYLDCLLLRLNLSLVLLIKVLIIKKHFVFQCSKNEEITFPHEFIFIFIPYFIGTILSKKSCQKLTGKNIKNGDSPFKPSAHLHWEAENGDLGALNYWGDLNWRVTSLEKGDLRPFFIWWYIEPYLWISPWNQKVNKF